VSGYFQYPVLSGGSAFVAAAAARISRACSDARVHLRIVSQVAMAVRANNIDRYEIMAGNNERGSERRGEREVVE
jgi:hypothetical protein